jgi:predicted AlkP superfamily pyrophosphatase or phosphodiesterase
MKTAIKQNNSSRRFIVVLLCLCALLPISGDAQRQASPRSSAQRLATNKPKLVVVIVVDQFRYDYLDRFGDLFGSGGFKRLMADGALFTSANYDYVPTVTAAGHAAVHTGSVPAMNGIYANYVTDRETGPVYINPKTGEPVKDPKTGEPMRSLETCRKVLDTCRQMTIVDDKATRVVSGKGVEGEISASPRAMLGTTIGDQMRLSNKLQSKVISISQKDRAAVLPGGHHPNGAFWLNTKFGGFITSDYYYRDVPVKQLPDWVQKFNERYPLKTGVPKEWAEWKLSKAAEAYCCAAREHLDTQNRQMLGKDFPYAITSSNFDYTPFVSDYLEEFAEEAIKKEQLGLDGAADLLAISFSAPDLVGHLYGPDSPEIVSIYENLDRTIAKLLKFIDGRGGKANTLIVVTGDHGVTPVPQLMQLRGYTAEVIDSKEIENIKRAVNQALKPRFGGDEWVVAFANDELFLDHKLMEQLKANPAEVERVAAEAALRGKGVAYSFTRTQIIEGRMPPGDLARRVMNGYDRRHGGDIWLITKPFHFFSEGFPLATTHGSPYNYDTHVPVIFYGAGVRAGRYNQECTPSDIAPTLAAILGVEPPSNRTGRVLVEAIASPIQGSNAGAK